MITLLFNYLLDGHWTEPWGPYYVENRWKWTLNRLLHYVLRKYKNATVTLVTR
jgi:hypothetical protein